MKKLFKSLHIFAIMFFISWFFILLFQQNLYISIPIAIIVIFIFYFLIRKNIWALKGNLAYIKYDFEKARFFLKKAINANVKSSLAYLYYATLILKEDDDKTTVFKILEKAKKYQKSILEERSILATMGTAHWLNGNISEGIKILENLREKHEYINESVLTTLGYMYLLQKNFEKAIEITNIALNIEPNYAPAIDNLGQIYFQKEEYELSKEYFEKAILISENLPDSNYFLGLIYEKEDNIEEAQNYFKKANICEITAFNTVSRKQIEEKLIEK